MKAIGYGEFFALETEGFSGPALVEAARERIKLDTLRYAKRQATFFRGLPAVHVLDAGPRAAEELAALLPGARR
jgi:tRNA A37 N6-isopentenylltransferase MiaA